MPSASKLNKSIHKAIAKYGYRKVMLKGIYSILVKLYALGNKQSTMSISLIILVILIILALFLVFIYNRFVKNRNMVKDAWSNIDVALKRRYDLIPNLVETVKGYAAHEQTTLEKVINARNAAMSVPSDEINAKINAENQLQQTLRSLFALGEAYPDLKANT